MYNLNLKGQLLILFFSIWSTLLVSAQEKIPVGKEFSIQTDSSHVMVACKEGVLFDLVVGSKSAYSDLKNGSIIPVYKGKCKYKILVRTGTENDFTVSFHGTEFPQRWMSYLGDDTELSDISIPGTHDSGTKTYSSLIKGLGRCQNMSIGQQLRDGIRFLDIRLTLLGMNNLVVAHGPVNVNLKFLNVLNSCKDFLEDNPGETIVMLVNRATSHGTPIGYAFQLAIDMADAPFYTKSRLPELGEARGKIVLVSRDPHLCREVGGVNLTDGWLYNTTFAMKSIDGEQFDIQDQFAHIDRFAKVATWKRHVERAMADDDVFYISFGSIAAGNDTPYNFAWNKKSGEAGCNHAFTDFLQTLIPAAGTKRLGTIMLDFYNDGGDMGEHGVRNELMMLILKSNFDNSFWKKLLPKH